MRSLVLFLLFLLSGRASTSAQNPYLLAITQKDLLTRLQEKGLSLSSQLEMHQKNRLYPQLVEFLGKDLRRSEADLGPLPPAIGPGRPFPISWLKSPDTYFELVGVINRLDRRPFLQNSCGEMRLIYRLAYHRKLRGRPVFSRLPMTINLVYELPKTAADPRCQETARRWSLSDSPSYDFILAMGKRENLSRLEVNLQNERWDPTFRPDLAGHAGYLLRVFRITRQNDQLVPEPLENTPDVRKLNENPALKNELREWLKKPQTLRAIDEGTASLPQKFLAEQVVSVTPFGLERRANRLFLQVFAGKDFDGTDLKAYRTIRTPAALLRRLDNLSCVGCHQSSSMAGFHFLGEDPEEDNAVNALFSPGSAHFNSDLERRKRYGLSLLEGKIPDEFRPFAERPEEGKGKYGAHCGLGDSGFETWKCADALECKPYYAPAGRAEVGQCLPRAAEIGDACEIGEVSESTDPHKDEFTHVKKLACARPDICYPRVIGFPAGMCARDCNALKDREGVCAAVPALKKFSDCLTSGSSFRECFKTAARPTGMRRCDLEAPCRDDYLCARFAAGEGACVPPYFLFQLVVNGHPPLR